jgi:hypothetical protein
MLSCLSRQLDSTQTFVGLNRAKSDVIVSLVTPSQTQLGPQAVVIWLAIMLDAWYLPWSAGSSESAKIDR